VCCLYSRYEENPLIVLAVEFVGKLLGFDDYVSKYYEYEVVLLVLALERAPDQWSWC
jgi:hypothetical protein